MKKIFLIDGNAVIYRMFYAIPDFTTSDGKHVNAIFGIAKFFVDYLKKANPDYLVFVRDARGKNFRHEIYTDYKATRERMPDNLISQVDDINHMISAFCTDVIEIPGVEADDVIGTLATEFKNDKENEIYILSGDKDLYSLVGENVKILDIIKKEVFDEKKTREKFLVDSRYIIDYLAIIGDSSDNIPGISGIGPKKAVPLINKFGTLENIYDFIDSGKTSNDPEIDKILSGKTLETIKNSREIAFLSKKLATIKKDVDLNSGDQKFDLQNYKFDENNLLNDAIVEIFKKFEFNSLLGENVEKNQKSWDDLGLKVQIIGDNNGLENLKKMIEKKSEIVLDTETTSLDVIEAKLVGISILLDEKNIFYINIMHSGPKVENSNLKNFIEFLLNSDIKIIGHNLKYDLEILELFLKNFKLEEKENILTGGQMSLDF